MNKAFILQMPKGEKFEGFVEFKNYEDIGFFPD